MLCAAGWSLLVMTCKNNLLGNHQSGAMGFSMPQLSSLQRQACCLHVASLTSTYFRLYAAVDMDVRYGLHLISMQTAQADFPHCGNRLPAHLSAAGTIAAAACSPASIILIHRLQRAECQATHDKVPLEAPFCSPQLLQSSAAAQTPLEVSRIASGPPWTCIGFARERQALTMRFESTAKVLAKRMVKCYGTLIVALCLASQ